MQTNKSLQKILLFHRNDCWSVQELPFKRAHEVSENTGCVVSIFSRRHIFKH